MLKQNGSFQRDPKEAVNQGKAGYQDAQQSLSLLVQATMVELMAEVEHGRI